MTPPSRAVGPSSCRTGTERRRHRGSLGTRGRARSGSGPRVDGTRSCVWPVVQSTRPLLSDRLPSVPSRQRMDEVHEVVAGGEPLAFDAEVRPTLMHRSLVLTGALYRSQQSALQLLGPAVGHLRIADLDEPVSLYEVDRGV